MAPLEDNSIRDGPEKVGEYVRIFKRGENWHASFQFHKKQIRQSLDTGNKKVARQRAAQIDVKLTAGVWKPAVERVGVGETVALYLDMLATEGRAPKTMAKYRQILSGIEGLAVKFGVRDMSAVDQRFLDAYRKLRISGGAAPKTIYNACVILRQLIRFALSRNLLAADPMPGLKMRKPKATEQPCWTREETLAILAAAPAEIRAALTLLAELGLRFGELAWLTWDDVDGEANTIHVRPKAGWKPKTGDQRCVPMSPAVRELLAGLPKTAAWVVPMPPSRIHPAGGRQWTEKRLLNSLKRVLKKLGLVGKLHTFRHAFISHALLGNTPVVTVKSWVGHVDPQVIELYTHVHDAASQAAMKELHEPKRPRRRK